MFVLTLRRLGLLAVLGCLLAPLLLAAGEEPPLLKPRIETFKGKVVPLADVVKTIGARLDVEASPQWLALVADDKKVYPLIKDDSTRMFFSDKALLNRPMELTGRLVPGSTVMQVLETHSIVKGERCEVYYWCDVCSIKRFEKKACDCCGGPLELREVPVQK